MTTTTPISAVFNQSKVIGRMYPARTLFTYDGDTQLYEWDQGRNTLGLEWSRLWGVDTPEVRGAEKEQGFLAKAFAETWLFDRRESLWIVTIQGKRKGSIQRWIEKKGKYGRYLVMAWADGFCLNDALVAEGHAKPYFGGKR